MNLMKMNLTVEANSTETGQIDYNSRFIGFPLEYRIVATIVHVVIFLCGVFGNTVVILLVRTNRSLQSPTYTYLVRCLLRVNACYSYQSLIHDKYNGSHSNKLLYIVFTLLLCETYGIFLIRYSIQTFNI